MYLYLAQQDNFDCVPPALLERFGRPEFVMDLELRHGRPLAREDVGRVMAALRAQGYFLQLPPKLKPDMYHGNPL